MQNTDVVTITFVSVSQNETLARSFAAAYAARLDPTLRELDDIKTAVSEAVTNAVVHAYPQQPGMVSMTLDCRENELIVQIQDEGVGIADVSAAREPMYTSRPGADRAGLGFTVMEAFMDELEVSSSLGKGTCVRMKKRIGRAREKSES